MAQYREFTAHISMSDTVFIITSQIAGHQEQAVVTRGGSEDADFKTAIGLHKDIALAAGATATSQPCSVYTLGKWLRLFPAASIATPSTKITVPGGNSGELILYRDAGSFTLQYSLAGGSFTTFTDGTTITVTDGQTLAFQATGITEQDTANGSVYDSDTGVLMDNISIMNTEPAP